MDNYPESLHDELEAYPLRLDVAALPERRFFKMIRTLTVSVVLMGALLIVLSVFVNYQITHLDVTIQDRNVWQFYRLNPLEKRLQVLEPATIRLDPVHLMVEERLRAYLIKRNSTFWDQQKSEEVTAASGLLAQLSTPEVFQDIKTEYEALMTKTRGKARVRETHIYDLKLVRNSDNLWVALIEVFDLPVTNDMVSACQCSDNSKECLTCKITNAKNRERYRIWMRTSFKNPARCQLLNEVWWCENPLGISIDSYIRTFVPIHDEEIYWNQPPALR